jgi:hypothetical protein
MAPPGPRDVATRRPQGSQPKIEASGDPLVDLGLVMAGQQRIESAQEELSARFTAIESAWQGVRTEHNTTQSEVVQLRKSVEDLLHQQKVTQRMIKRLGKFGPALLGLIEVIRYLAEHVQQIPKLH